MARPYRDRHGLTGYDRLVIARANSANPTDADRERAAERPPFCAQPGRLHCWSGGDEPSCVFCHTPKPEAPGA